MFDINKRFKIEVPGRGGMALGPNDHVTSGGEGHIYRKGPITVKIWDDPDRAAKGRMTEKVKLLAGSLKHSCIVTPEALAFDEKGGAVGFVMPWVDRGWALPLAFTTDWRDANAFDDRDAVEMAAGMREVVAFTHGRGAILGDGNELNIIGVRGKAGVEPRYIDVDSWVLPGFPGDKVLPTIQDWHAPSFSKQADWFAWAVVTFQLFTGIHPFRGTHPDFKRKDIEGRMRSNASVFDPRVRMSPSVRDFSCIPGGLLDWYQAVFVDGLRDPPPDPRVKQIAPRAATKRRSPAVTTGALKVTDLYPLPAVSLRTVAPDTLMLKDGTLITLGEGRPLGRADTAAAFIRMPDGAVVGSAIADGRVSYGILKGAPNGTMALQDAGMAATATWSAENRLFALVHDGLLELQIHDLGARRACLPGRKWSLNPNSTVLGDGLAVFDALGAKFLVVPFGTEAVGILRARELDKLRPLSMVRRGRVAVLSLIDQAGAYHRAVVVFEADFSGYRIDLEDADAGTLTEAISDAGVVVRFDGAGKLELTMPVTGAKREADAGQIAGARLLAGPSGVFSASSGAVSKLSLV